MSKISYLPVFLFDVGVVFWNSMQISDRNNQLAKDMKRVLYICIFTMISYVSTFVHNDYNIISLEYSCMYVGIDWLLYNLLVFSKRYTEYDKSNKKIKYVAMIILIMDSLIQIINPFYEISCTYQIFDIEGSMYLSIIPYIPYKIHLVICYIMVVWLIFYYVRKWVITPKMYRNKYSMICIMFVFIILLNALFVFTTTYLDYSILTYAVLATGIQYFAFFYKPKKFIDNTKFEMFEQIEDAVVVFDISDHVITCNRQASEIFEKHSNEKLTEEISKMDFLDTWKMSQTLNWNENQRFEWRMFNMGKERYFNIVHQRMFDEKKRLLGSFLSLHETTEKRYLESYDRLTGIYNRDHFCSELEQKLSKEWDEGLVLVVFDIQCFKMVNEAMGSEMGDKVLQEIASILLEHRRNEYMFGRMSSDYFLLCGYEENIDYNVLEAEINKKTHALGMQIELKICFGVYRIVRDNITVESMCEKALLALQAIKGNYYNNISYYEESMSKRLIDEQFISGEMNIALEQEQFEVYLQPQYDAIKEQIVGAEALVRWNHPERGFLSPGIFIPIFEKNGFITKLDFYVWDKTCQYLAKWLNEGIDISNLSISVNISRMDLYFIDLYKTFGDLRRKYHLPKDALKLEVTESAYIADEERMMGIMYSLQRLGFTVEMDDFGSGYSSLNSLKKAPVNVLKLDMKFITGREIGNRGEKIVSSVVKMANAIGMSVIAEGVETKEQAQLMKNIGCQTIQGYYYAKPMSLMNFEDRYVKPKKMKNS